MGDTAMPWDDALWSRIQATLEAERNALRRLEGREDSRLGLHWLNEVALQHVIWKGLVSEFGATKVHPEVAATSFEGTPNQKCDFVIELGSASGDRTLWLEVKLLQRIDTPEQDGWNDWNSWTQKKYFASIARDLHRWSQPPTEVKDYDHLACNAHGLLLLTFWGPKRKKDKPQKRGHAIPKAKAIASKLSPLGSLSLSDFTIRTWQTQDCAADPSQVGFEGHDIYLQCDLLLRDVPQRGS